MDTFYDIYSTGKLIDGADLAQTRVALARLFKTNEDEIAHLIAGKPQLIKKRVEKNEAIRYKAALQQAGLLIGIKAHEKAVNSAPTVSSKASEPLATNANPPPSYSFSIAPAGSDILLANEKKTEDTLNIDTSHIKLAPSFTAPATSSERPIITPDISHLSLGEIGSPLRISEDIPPVATPDISHISVAEVGSVLDEIKPDLPPLNPDTSYLQLAETGADIVPAEYRKPVSVTAPSTDHIQLIRD